MDRLSVEASDDIRREAERYEPRVQRAYVVFHERLMKSVDRDKLEEALETGDVRRVMRLFPMKTVEKLLQPLARILEDELNKSAKIHAREAPPK